MLGSGQQLVVAGLLRDGASPLQELAEVVLNALLSGDGRGFVSCVHHDGTTGGVSLILPLKINYKPTISIAASSSIMEAAYT